MATKNAKTAKIVCFSVTAVILVLVLAINIAVGIFADVIDKFVVGYKDNSGNSTSGIRLEKEELSEQIQAEGVVLVKNEQHDGSALLPLKSTDVPKVNVFGWASVDWVISGSGSGQVKRSGSTDLYAALEEVGIEYNTELRTMYRNFRQNREYSIAGSHAGSATQGNPGGSGSLHTFNFEFSRLYEPDIDERDVYSEDILSNARSFSNTAIVVIGRVSGESNDSPKAQYKWTKGGTIVTDNTRTYLEISTEEEHLLKYVGNNFENVIVLINSTNVMELGFMETIPGLDSCLVVATTGTAGAKAIPKIIYNDLTDEEGNVVSYTPSGKLADTYAYDLSTSSTYVDTGSGMESTHFYTNTMNPNFRSNGEGSRPSGSANSNGLYPSDKNHTNGSINVPYKGVAYEEYREGIYVGYKWYETADEMGFWTSDVAKQHWTKPDGSGPIAGYDDVVQYPFGYGLSYTTFEWEVKEVSHNSISSSNAKDTIKIGVNVTNTGSVAGQDVVQLYFSFTPDNDKGIERASVNLVAFAKTQTVIQPGDSEYVELEFKVSDLASYDYEGKILSNGGYVLEAGTYTLSLRTDAHTVATDKMTKKGDEIITYNVNRDIHVNEESENRFTGSNTTDGVAIDVNSDPDSFTVGGVTYTITYLSRFDFEGTFPFEMSENVAMSDKVKAFNTYSKSQADDWDDANDNGSIMFDNGDSMPVYEDGAINELGFELGMNYDSEMWDAVLDSIKKSEMENLVLHGYTKTSAVNSIGKPETRDLDGPNQAGSFQDSWSEITGYSSIALAQTWNAELSYTMGLAVGKECAEHGISGLYGPGVNVHRSPFGGRNYEYYSEDALMSGVMCAKFVSAAKNRGVYCYLKHICLYESESNRDGMYTWLTEQALREIYLRPFEIAVKDGGSSAIMTSYGRIGAVWTGGSEALLTEVVRDEWGFKGAFLTDYADYHDFMNGDQMIRAGGDIWMDGFANNGSFTKSMQGTNAYDYALRRATKNILYMWLNAEATRQDYNTKIENGEITDDVVVQLTPPELNFRWYIPVVVAIDVIGLGGCGYWMYTVLRKKKATADTTTEGGSDAQE